MRRMALLLAVALFALNSCSTPAPAVPDAATATGTPKQHIAAAESTVTLLGNALAVGDSAAVGALTSDHFVLIEDGRSYSAPEMLVAASAALAHGHMTRTVSELRTHEHGHVAWTHYTVTLVFDAGKQPVTSTRLETAVLERNDDETWDVVLMSSMPAAK